MSPALAEVIQQTETLSTEEQSQLVAYLTQKLTQSQATATPTSQPPTPETGKSIWQIAEDFAKDLPDAELHNLPADGAEQHDHYIYGTPKIDS
jgi:hypothetical protein